MNRLSDSEKAVAASVVDSLGSKNGQVTESILAGMDTDGLLKLEAIDFYLSNGSTRGFRGN
jgi:hypothetical protein